MPRVMTQDDDAPDPECSTFVEGEKGLILQNDSGVNVGYVRYDELQRVEPREGEDCDDGKKSQE